MPTLLSFYPSETIARSFDQTTRDKLADSLTYLAGFCSEGFTLPQKQLDRKLDEIRTRTILPETLAAYYDLVGAIQSENFSSAQSLFQEILESKTAGDTLEVIPFLPPQADSPSRHYLKQIDTDPENPFNIRPASQEDFNRAKQLISEALELLKAESPELFKEITTLLKRIMLGSGPSEPGEYTFDGASAPGLWGAIVLNADEPEDVVDMVQTLSHESCHNLLFGYCINDRLVNNSDDERFSSPLRIDPRPLDGIFHATFVLARMYYAAATIADSPQLSPELQQKAKQEMKDRQASFYDGLSTLKTHADYTEQGKALINRAEAYMNGAIKNAQIGQYP